MLFNSLLRKFTLSIVAGTFYFTVNAQQMNDFGFLYWPEPDCIIGSKTLANAWAGGLNSVQLGEIDLNNDGLKDLIAFDRHGNRLLPFVFKNNLTPQYHFDPHYTQFFPPIKSVFQIHDYNHDGKPDLFTYTTGGLMVYRNISDITIKFEKAVDQFIKSLQGNTFTNLLITNVDYPAIIDIDDDGDLDILTFWGLGSFMELHRNMSVETYGNSDSLLFHKVDYCWGRFAEGAESNEIFLDTCVTFSNRDLRHTGSTIAVVDINHDNVKDLLIGDVDFAGIKALVNGGSNLEAQMINLQNEFPANDPIYLPSFPSVQFFDLFNDGVKDAVASPFDPGLYKSAGYNSIWHYSVPENGSWQLLSKAFLQNEMIDVGLGSYPVLTDVTGDNLADLLISNYGSLDSSYYDINGHLITVYHSSISFYKNTGTATTPQFTHITDDFANLGGMMLVGLFPAFADVNNDQQTDMLVGTGDGQLLLYINIGNSSSEPTYADAVRINTQSMGTFLTPAFIDLNNDGLQDIICGNRNGKLSYLQNTGTLQNPEYQLITNDYGGVNVTDQAVSYTGFSVPFVYKDNAGKQKLFVGSESGKIFYYPDLSSDPTAILVRKDDVFGSISEGIRTSVALKDLNNDGYPDMAVGNYGGGVKLFKGTLPGPSGIGDPLSIIGSLKISPNPANEVAKITMPFKQKWELTIVNSHGVVCERFVINGNSLTLDISKLRSGLYLITASQSDNNNQILTGKLLITQ